MQDQSPKPKHVWNRVPDEVKRKVVDFALQETELSPRELAVTFTDQERYFVSEFTVYRVLKAHDLITSPAFIVQPSLSSLPQQSPESPEQRLQIDVNDGEEEPTGAVPVEPIAFFIQAGAFGSSENLLRSRELLVASDLEVQTEEIVVNGQSLTRLLVVGRASDNQGDTLRRVHDAGFPDAFLR